MSFITKDSFRKSSLKKLQFFSKVAKLKKDKTICSKISYIIDLHKPKKILFYVPLKTEVDIRPLIIKLRKKKNVDVYVPFMKGKSFVPVKYRLPLKRKRFGILEPNFSMFIKNELDMIVVPIVGIDKTNRRVGFGAGMYDRFYEKLKIKPITIFTQLKLCRSKELVTNDHDISADYIITE